MHASAPVVNIFSARPEIKFRNEMKINVRVPFFQVKIYSQMKSKTSYIKINKDGLRRDQRENNLM